MNCLIKLFCNDFKRRLKDSFLIGYNVIFPVVLILLLGYLTSENYSSKFTGYQYYSVVLIPFCVALAIISAAYAGKEEAYRKTAVRFLFAPVTRTHIVLAKLLSCTIVIGSYNLVVLIFSMVALRLPIAHKILPIFLLLLSETFTVSAVGLFIGYGMKNFIFVKNVLNIPILLSAILAGAFYPIGTLNPKLKVVIQLSPLTWVNRSLFLYIYDDRVDLLRKTGLISIGIGLCFTMLAIKKFRKEEFIHGDLPGYEK